MRFTSRIWIGFGLLVGMLGLAASIALFDLDAIRAVLRELVDVHLPLDLTARTLEDALDDLDDAERALRGGGGGSRAQAIWQQTPPRIEAALVRAEEVAADPETRALVAGLAAAWGDHRARLRTLFEGGGPSPGDIEATRQAVRSAARTFRDRAAERIEAADERGLRLARRQMFWMALVCAAMLLAAPGLARAAVRHLVRPLERLTRAVRAVTEGGEQRRLPADTGDELSETARAVNELLDRFEAERSNGERERSEAFRLVQAQLEREDGPAVLVDPYGRVRMANARASERLHAPSDFRALEAAVTARLRDESTEEDGRIAGFDALSAGGSRRAPDGYVVRLAARGDASEPETS